MSERVWFITGGSTGIGQSLAKRVLEHGDRAAISARNPEALRKLTEQFGERALALTVDVTQRDMIAEAVEKTEKHFGKINVLVNNAGYGYFSAIEEGEESEIRRQFETNVFGLFEVTKQVLPGMRRRRSGNIVMISSIGGLMAFPATGYYHASKFAVEGYSESLAQEVGPLGIKVTIVEPGRFRTDWAGRSMVESKTVIDDYAETAGVRRKQVHEYSGTQPGDPNKAAGAIIKAVNASVPPLRLLLGPDAYQMAQKRLSALSENFEAWKHVSVDTDFDN